MRESSQVIGCSEVTLEVAQTCNYNGRQPQRNSRRLRVNIIYSSVIGIIQYSYTVILFCAGPGAFDVVNVTFNSSTLSVITIQEVQLRFTTIQVWLCTCCCSAPTQLPCVSVCY